MLAMKLFSLLTFVNTSATVLGPNANFPMALIYHLIAGEYKPLLFSFSIDMNLITIVFVSLHSNCDEDCSANFNPASCFGGLRVVVNTPRGAVGVAY